MKRILAIALLAVMILSGCGGEQPATTPETETTAPQQTTEAPTETTTEAPSETTGEAAQDKKALAESCIDKSVEELYALIGQPNSSDYAPSCAGEEGAEDGNLYYDGFTVYTLKQGDSETVVFVE